MQVSWIAWAIVSVATLAVSNVYQRKFMKDGSADPYATALFFQFGGGVVFILWLLFSWHWGPVPSSLWANWILMGAGYGLGTLFIFKSLQLLDSGDATVLFSLRAVVSMILAALFLSEHVNGLYIVGAALIVTAVYLVSAYGKKIRMGQGAAYAIFSALCYGVAIVNDAYILKRYSIPLNQFLVFGFTIPGIFLLLYKPKKLNELLGLVRNWSKAKVMVVVVLLYSISAFAFYSALRAGADASRLAPFNQSTVVITVLLAMWLLKERERVAIKLLAALLAGLGAYLLTL